MGGGGEGGAGGEYSTFLGRGDLAFYWGTW